jgi:hypothetical protein
MRQPEQANVQSMVTACAAIAGTAQQFTGTLTRCTGADERYGYKSIANNTTATLDDSIDWRDRLMRVDLTASTTTTILPGDANDMNVSPPSPEAALSVAVTFPFLSSIQINGLFYTGLGWDGAAALPNYIAQTVGINHGTSQADPRPITLFADSVTGALKCKNTDGGTRVIAFWVRVTPPLGGRSTIL